MTVALYRKGPCTVKYGGAVVGQTEGDVVFKYSPEWRMVVPDQTLGPQGAFIFSEAVEVTVPIVPRADAWDIIRSGMFPVGLTKAEPTADDGASTVNGAHVAGDTTLDVADGSEFAQDKVIKIGTGSTVEYRYIVSININELTLNAGLTYAHAGGEAVIEVKGSYLDGAEAIGQTTLSVTDETEFAEDDLIMIGEGADAELRTVSGTGTGTIDVTEGIGVARAVGTLVFVLDADPSLRVAVGNNRNFSFMELLIEPLDGSDSIKVYKAVCTGEVETALKKEEESIIELTFAGVEDTSRNNGDRLAAIGLLSVA